MKFFIENKELDSELESIINRIRLRMNGTTVGQMEGRGIRYRVNYGVGFPHLKELASMHRSDYTLAERLWHKEIRETMLLAAMLVPAKEMTIERCRDWAALINNIDLVERTSMLLWGQLPIADELVNEWREADNKWLQILSNYTKGWSVYYSQKTSTQEIDNLINDRLWQEDYFYLKSIAFAVKKMLRVNGISTPKLKNWVKEASQSESEPLKITAQDIISEIQFVDEGK
ncbi:DNA alkylation repair protein [Carboxylicivirga caseinilyticus]|uniref:DNA alkylation repair protein n=1 Tax=Carboxylicivirga caseinilyticus TaxID=3417572 RepID=UPI003D346FC1|nr:DNA alkylation repair protein [Marinilabiliaceae bacterium A049]